MPGSGPMKPTGYLAMIPRYGRQTWVTFDADSVPTWFKDVKSREREHPGARIKPLQGEAWRRLSLDELVKLYGAELRS